MRPARLILAFALLAGCAASHPTEADLCVTPAPLSGVCGAVVHGLPSGVCRTSDGELLAYSDGDHSLGGCGPTDGGSYGMVVNHCAAPSERGRRVVSCGPAPTGDVVRFEGSRSAREYPLPAVGCAWPTEGEAAEPFGPFDELREVCVDARSWCGVPVALELVGAGYDPCDGTRYVYRCESIARGARIEVRAQTALGEPGPCATAVAARVARCPVMVPQPGTYEVVDGAGRHLAEVEIGDVAESERRCNAVR